MFIDKFNFSTEIFVHNFSSFVKIFPIRVFVIARIDFTLARKRRTVDFGVELARVEGLLSEVISDPRDDLPRAG